MAEAQVSKINQEELIKKVDDLEKRLETKDAEIQVYKMLMGQMEEELAQAKKFKVIQEKQTQDVDSLKSETEKTLTKAKSMIFEKTKIIKNQELQIEAFGQQIESLKDVIRITKDLLEIRNLEVQQLEIKIDAIEGKQKAEKERYDLMHKKLETMIRHNADLKREYETQLCLFTALRQRYNERELAKDVVDNLKTGNAKEVTGKLDNTAPVTNETNTTNSNNAVTVSNNVEPNTPETIKQGDLSPAVNENKNETVSNDIETLKPNDLSPVVDAVSSNMEVTKSNDLSPAVGPVEETKDDAVINNIEAPKVAVVCPVENIENDAVKIEDEVKIAANVPVVGSTEKTVDAKIDIIVPVVAKANGTVDTK